MILGRHSWAAALELADRCPASSRNVVTGTLVHPVAVALRAALIKKEVPVKVVTDPAKAELLIKSTSSHREDSTATKIAKIAFFGGGSFGHFEGSIEVIDNESSAVVFAYNVKKGNYQSAAEAFAKHFKNDYLAKKKP